jgi:hypothetical protein
MDNFIALERAALDAILLEAGALGSAVERQLSGARVMSRENTGGGFFADIRVDPDAELLDPKTPPMGQNVWIGIDGLEYGLGAILHYKDGRANLLEGYGVGPEDTSSIDFVHVQFAIIHEPGPLPTSGS